MDLLIFDCQEKQIINKVTIREKGITFTKSLTDLLQLNGKKIIVAQDKANPKNWYFKTAENGYKTAKYTRGYTCIYARDVAKAIFKSLNLSGDYSIRCVVSTEPNEQGYYAIITNSAKRVE